jgi:hypothetical protein
MSRRKLVDFKLDIYSRAMTNTAGKLVLFRAAGMFLLLSFRQREQEQIVFEAIRAGTDFSAIFNETNTDLPYIDCSRLHVTTIMRYLFENRTGGASEVRRA